ncbi:MAG TPA: DMT family transporter [Tepidisphaeraceae bacterium]|nr:DMT family transporter [Tepidisphaeraceae bacterium]
MPVTTRTATTSEGLAANDDRARLRSRGILLLLVASVLWSLSGLAVKLAAMDPLAFAMWRSLAGAVALGVAVWFAPGRWPRANWMIPTVLVYTAVVALLLAAMTFGTAARGILLQYTGPIFCAIFAWFFQRRRIGAYTAAALVVAATGIAVMIAGAPAGDGWVGPTCGLLSGVAFGALILLLEKVNRTGDGLINPIAITFLNNAGAALILVVLCLAIRTPLLGDAKQMTIVAITGVIQLAIPYALFQVALKHVEPVDASLLILLEPVLNPVWVALAVGERPDLATIIGGAAILAAMVIEALKPDAPEKTRAADMRRTRHH